MKRKSSVVRGAAVAVVGLMAIATLMVPASAHVNSPLTFKHLKKHFYTKAKSNARFINVGETATNSDKLDGLDSTAFLPAAAPAATVKDFGGLVKMNEGDPAKTIASFGPFTFIATCIDSAGSPEARVEIRTSEANSIFWSAWWGGEDDFDPSDTNGPIYVFDFTGSTLGTPDQRINGDQFKAAAPSGAALLGMTGVMTSTLGAHCVFDGYAIDVA